jgi:lia operon protein LiaG
MLTTKNNVMKTMKICLIMLFIFSTAGILSGQEYKIAVQNTKEGKLILKNFNGKLPVTGYSGSDIIFTTDSEEIAPPAKAKGLKAIYPSGTDNTGVGLDVQKNGNVITATCLLPFTRMGEFQIKVPDNFALEFESGCERANEISVENTKNEIDIKSCHDIHLKNVSGPLVLATISGDIDVTFGSINSDKPFSVNSISGEIDVTLPSKTAADLDLRTVNGGVYSDFDFAETKKDLKKVGGNELNYQLNGGGFKFSIVTVSGNIYLRKGN